MPEIAVSDPAHPQYATPHWRGSSRTPEICNRCLIQVNATTSVRAIFHDRIENFEYPTDPWMLRAWAETKLEQDARIEINDTTGRLRAISTWHGDPVCSVHLWCLVDAEQKRGYRA